MSKKSFPGEGSFVVGRKSNGRNRNFSNLTGPTLSPANPADGGGVGDDGTVIINPPALPTLPVFPDFTIMGCKELGATIEDLKQTLNAPSLVANTKEWVDAYVNAINMATALYNSKGCATAPDGGSGTGGGTPPIEVTVNNNPPLITTTSGVPGASAGFPAMGGGGGGGSSSPAAAAKAKKVFPWLLVIFGGAALYFFTAKKSS